MTVSTITDADAIRACRILVEFVAMGALEVDDVPGYPEVYMIATGEKPPTDHAAFVKRLITSLSFLTSTTD